MSIAENIKLLRRIYGISQKELGLIAHVSDKAVSTWETGFSEPRMGAIQRMADHFNLKKSNIIEENGMDGIEFSRSPKPTAKAESKADTNRVIENNKPQHHAATFKPKPLPIIGTIACGTPILAEENIEAYVDCPMDVDADFCLRARGESMINADIQDGDIVFIKQTDHIENGEIAAVRIHDEATLKRLRYTEKTGELLLIAENDDFPSLTYSTNDESNDIHIEGRAVAVLHKLK